MATYRTVTAQRVRGGPVGAPVVGRPDISAVPKPRERGIGGLYKQPTFPPRPELPFETLVEAAEDNDRQVIWNAWSLAHASAVVYRTEREVEGVVQNIWGMEAGPGGKCFINDEEGDTQCFVARKDDNIVVSFRGTQGLRDMVTDATFFKKQCRSLMLEGVKCQVHKGFWNCLQRDLQEKGGRRFIDLVNDRVRELKNGDDNVSIYITGHSLGGALATLAAAFMLREKDLKGNVKGLYTFGSPRVGDHAFTKKLARLGKDLEVHRFQNRKDLVARVPCINYRHVKGTWWKLQENENPPYRKNEKGLPGFEARVLDVMELVGTLISDIFSAHNSFRDHMLHRCFLRGGYIEGLEKNMDKLVELNTETLLQRRPREPFVRDAAQNGSQTIARSLPTDDDFETIALAWSLAKACEAATNQPGDFSDAGGFWGFEGRKEGARFLVASREDIILVIFPDQPNRERLTTLNRKKMVKGPLGGKVWCGLKKWLTKKHRGSSAKGQIFKSVKEVLKDCPGRIYVTGHGTGGGLATLATAYMLENDEMRANVAGLYTFGAPPVGDPTFRDAFAKATEEVGTKVHRFENRDDVAGQFPVQKIGYVHVGRGWKMEGPGQLFNFTRGRVDAENGDGGLGQRIGQAFNPLTSAINEALEFDGIDSLEADRMLSRAGSPNGYIENLEVVMRWMESVVQWWN